MSIFDGGDLQKKQWIKRDIELKIITGEYQAGERVPSVRSLAKLYHVGTSTSQTVLEKMSQEGTLIMEQGIGFKVNGKTIKRLRREHEKRLYGMIEQACAYARLLKIDPLEIFIEVKGKSE